jgi:multidrug efflux pump subunit AcrA (membrane-fusion protein)
VLELANPELEYATRQAELDLRAEEAALRDLPARLEIERLTEEGALLALAAECRRLAVAARADRELEAAGAVPALTRDQSTADTEGCTARHGLAARRLERLRASATTRIAAQQARVDSLRALHLLRRRQVEALVVLAGNRGVLEDVPVEVGQRVAIGTTLAKVAPPDRLKAVLRIGEGEAQDLAPGLRAAIDLRTGKATGSVVRVEPAVRGGTVTVDVALEGPLPPGARSALSVDGVIDLDRAADVLLVGRPMTGEPSPRPGAQVALYRLDREGTTASRAEVTLGRASATAVEVLSGLAAGDRVILSDMSAWDAFPQIRFQ